MSQSVFILYLLVPTLQRIYMQLTLSELFKRRTKWKYAIEFLCSILFHFCVLTMTYFQSLKTLLIKYCGLEQCLATDYDFPVMGFTRLKRFLGNSVNVHFSFR